MALGCFSFGSWGRGSRNAGFVGLWATGFGVWVSRCTGVGLQGLRFHIIQA